MFPGCAARPKPTPRAISNHQVRSALVSLGKEAQETNMKKLSPTTLGLMAAIAISAGGVLVQHPLYTDPAPGTYADITIAEADNQKVPPVDKAGTPTPPQAAAPANPSTADVPPAVETTPGEESKGAPPRKP
jgi:hypothetical protein